MMMVWFSTILAALCFVVGMNIGKENQGVLVAIGGLFFFTLMVFIFAELEEQWISP